MPLKLFIMLSLCLFSQTPLLANAGCGEKGVWLQVLGSGGPEVDDQRASSGYVIWHDGKARILVDLGAGSLLHFEQSGASINDLDYILLSHFHVDHVNDLAELVKASYFTDRNRDLPLYGPTGNQLMPSADRYVQALFGTAGAYKYLSSYLDGSDSYRLLAHNVEADEKKVKDTHVVVDDFFYHISTVPVHHGPIPSLAWRIDIGGKSIVFSGDMNNDNNSLEILAKQADLLVAHHAIPEEATGIARDLHMPPTVIGKIAVKAKVKQLVLSHRMNRTLGREPASTHFIRQAYSGPLYYAEDMQCFQP